MGTQFSSRLTAADRNRIRNGISSARTEVLGDAGLDPKFKPTKNQSQKIADATVREIFRVIDQRDLFTDLGESNLFVEVLKWLKELYSDAAFNNFQGIIERYRLNEFPLPPNQLRKELNELIDRVDKNKIEKFRIVIRHAAIALLGYVVTLDDPSNRKSDDIQAEIFGKKLSNLSIKEIVTMFIESFINGVVETLIDSADPRNEEVFKQSALNLTEMSARKITNGIVGRIIEEGKLNDNYAIHQIVVDELRKATGIDA